MEITRKAYMKNEISFQEYYRHIAKLAGIAFNPDDPFIGRVRKALAAGDDWLNTIPLQAWYMKAACAQPAIKRAMKEVPGEFWSIAGGVCVMKQAAMDAAEKIV